MRAFEQIFATVLRQYVQEAMNEPVGLCTVHGDITRAEMQALGGCKSCHEEKLCQAPAKPTS